MTDIKTLEQEIDRILKSNAAVQVYYDRDSMEDYSKLVPEIMQALNLYIEERERLARIDELEYVSSDVDGWLFTTAGGKEQDVQDRIKELESK